LNIVHYGKYSPIFSHDYHFHVFYIVFMHVSDTKLSFAMYISGWSIGDLHEDTVTGLTNIIGGSMAGGSLDKSLCGNPNKVYIISLLHFRHSLIRFGPINALKFVMGRVVCRPFMPVTYYQIKKEERLCNKIKIKK
jgi:hypothetical protein